MRSERSEEGSVDTVLVIGLVTAVVVGVAVYAAVTIVRRRQKKSSGRDIYPLW